jgi:hypothetical protein
MSPLPRATSPVASPLPQTQHCPTLESPTPTLENCAYASLFLLTATKLCIDVRQVSISVESEPVNTRPTRAFLIMTETLTIVGYDQELPADHPVDGVHTFPMSMTAAAFLGIAWYLCAELNVRLLLKATRRSLYFWACLLCSWGIIIHCLVIVLDNFKVWKTIGSLVIIELSWCTFVVAQSVVLYSRLSLVLNNDRILGHVFRMIVVNAVVFGLGTVVLGLVIVSVNNDLWEVQSLTGAATPGSQYDFEVGQSQPHMGHDPIRCFLCPRSPHRSLVHPRNAHASQKYDPAGHRQGRYTSQHAAAHRCQRLHHRSRLQPHGSMLLPILLPAGILQGCHLCRQTPDRVHNPQPTEVFVAGRDTLVFRTYGLRKQAAREAKAGCITEVKGKRWQRGGDDWYGAGGRQAEQGGDLLVGSSIVFCTSGM